MNPKNSRQIDQGILDAIEKNETKIQAATIGKSRHRGGGGGRVRGKIDTMK